MENFKPNTYIELFNPAKNNYFPIRILTKIENGYKVLILERNKEINIYHYQLKTYGYKYIWIDEKIMNALGFEKDGFKYRLNNFLVFECLIGDIKSSDHPFHLFEFSSKLLGFAFLKNDELKAFQSDYEKINFNEKEHPIKEKYFFSSNINDIFLKLIEINSKEFNYTVFDKIITENH